MKSGRALAVAACLLIASAGPASRAAAQGGAHGQLLPGFAAECSLSAGGNRVTVQVRAQNGSEFDLTGVTASHLNENATGSADLTLTTMPSMRSVLIRNNGHSFKWQGSVSGEGSLTICTDVTAETPAGVTVTTGEVCCDPLTLTVPPTNTPRILPTLRPTRTPLPTSTPRPRLEIPTNTPRPTRTPLQTNTPRARLEIPTNTPRPTRTPLQTNTPRARLEIPTNTPQPTRTPLQTNTPRTPLPTNTPRQPLPTRTPQLPDPTRTPTPTIAIDQGALTADCHIFQANDSVSVYLAVTNNTGAAVTSVRALDLNGASGGGAAEEEGGAAALSLSLSGPAPSSYSVVANRATSTFKWTGSVTGSGTASISASAVAIGLGGAELSTGEVECGEVNVEEAPPAPFDPTGLIARCVAGAYDGPVLVSFFLDVVNATGADLTNLTAFGPEIETTGSVELNVVSGPQPRSLRVLTADRRARFKWQGNGGGLGLAFIHVGATATGPNGELVTTGSIECNTLVIPPKPQG